MHFLLLLHPGQPPPQSVSASCWFLMPSLQLCAVAFGAVVMYVVFVAFGDGEERVMFPPIGGGEGGGGGGAAREIPVALNNRKTKMIKTSFFIGLPLFNDSLLVSYLNFCIIPAKDKYLKITAV